MAKQILLDYSTASAILKEMKLWAGGAIIAWVRKGKKNGFPFAHKAIHAVDVIRDGVKQSPEGWQVCAYYHASPNPELAPKFSMSFLVGGVRLIGIDEGPGGHHENRDGEGEQFFGQKVGHPHVHFPVPTATTGYAEPLSRMPHDDYWTLFQAKIKMSKAPKMHLPMEEPKQGELLS